MCTKLLYPDWIDFILTSRKTGEPFITRTRSEKKIAARYKNSKVRENSMSFVLIFAVFNLAKGEIEKKKDVKNYGIHLTHLAKNVLFFFEI